MGVSKYKCVEGWVLEGRVLGVPHIVARFDSNGELGLNEIVRSVCKAGAGLELAAGGAVRSALLVLLEPAMEKAEVALIRVQTGARWRGAEMGRGRRLQGHHVRVRHDFKATAVIFDGDRARAGARARAAAGRAGSRPSADAGEQEREHHTCGRRRAL